MLSNYRRVWQLEQGSHGSKIQQESLLTAMLSRVIPVDSMAMKTATPTALTSEVMMPLWSMED